MDTEITPDHVMRISKKWQQAILSGIKPKERLAGLTLKDRLDGLTLRDVLAEFSPEDIEAHLKKMRNRENQQIGKIPDPLLSQMGEVFSR